LATPDGRDRGALSIRLKRKQAVDRIQFNATALFSWRLSSIYCGIRSVERNARYCGSIEGERQMPTLDEIGQEKQRLAERLARLDSEREKLAGQLNELEVAERVLARFGVVEAPERRRRGRPARAVAAAPEPPRRGRAARPAPVPATTMSLSEATLQAVRAHPQGATANEILDHLSREYGLKVRPNHLGIALQRHRRGGRLEIRDSRWFLPPESHRNTASTEHEAVTG
jgi:hypothetical protein